MRGEEAREAVIAFTMKARTASSGWARGSCPFCLARLGKPDRRGSFGVNMRSGRYQCFRCAASGWIKLGSHALPPLVGQADSEDAPRAIQPPEGFTELRSHDARASISFMSARRYVAKRGLSDALVAEARVGACARGPHAGRVVVPVLAEDDTWLWWVGRAWSKVAERPYMYPKGGRGDCLYNHTALLVETDEPVIVVEGVFDALAYWPHAIAVLGKPTHAQVHAMASARRPIAIVLDGDAWEEGEMLALRLRLDGQRAGSVKLPPRIDPDEVDKEWLRAEARASIR